MLTLTEELYLALHYSEKEESVIPLNEDSSHLIAAGGLTAELALAGRVRVDETELIVVDAEPTGDDLLDDALRGLDPSIAFAADDGEWFAEVAYRLPSGSRLLDRLVEKGVIRPLQKRKWMGLSTTLTYPFQDGSVLQRWQDLQMEVMVNGRAPTPQEAVLLFMSEAWGRPLPASLSRKERKTASKRWMTLFGDYWGIYPDEPTEPILGLDPIARTTIGSTAVSWATVQFSYVHQDIANFRSDLRRFT